MKKYKSRDPRRQKQYEVLMEMARDPNSTLYNPDGSQRKGASHRDTFWRGYNFGMKYPHLAPGPTSISYCMFRAGMDFKAETEGEA